MTSSTLSPTPSALSQRTFNGVSLCLFAGGALWVAHYAMQLVMGFSTGAVKPDNRLWTIDGLFFTAAVIGLCTGLLCLGTQVSSRWAQVGMVFAAVAATSIVFGLVRFALTGQPPGVWGGVGVIGSCVSSTLLAIAVRRNRVLDSGLGNMLLAIGLFTFPLIVAFAFPAGKWMPAYITDELPFALSGLAWIAFAARLRNAQLGEGQSAS